MSKRLRIKIEDGLTDAARIASQAVQDKFDREVIGTNPHPDIEGFLGMSDAEWIIEE